MKKNELNRPGLRRRHGWQALAVTLLLATTCTTQDGALELDPAKLPPELGQSQQSVSVPFAAGSLIIPMDNTYQDSGMLRAYGLVYKMLVSNITVNWVINKPNNLVTDTDLTTAVTDIRTNTVISAAAYRGGPMVIAAADRTAALALIAAWNTTTPVVTVHSANGAFSGEVLRSMNAAPRIAVFADGFETIAFSNLNAAGVPDSTGQAWPAVEDTTRTYSGYPDVLNSTKVRGTKVGPPADGALIRADGTPAFCHITSMHYSITPDDEVVAEVRAWLNLGPSTHAFMQCYAIGVFENSTSGRFITTQGLRDDGNSPGTNVTNRVPADPLTQYDGTFNVDSGSIDSIGLAGGSTFRANSRTLINRTGSGLTSRMTWVTGYLDGDTSLGKVTYLAGHTYSRTTPMSSNSLTNGVRLFLNSLLESPCASSAGQPALTFTKSAPALTNASNITYTLDYSNAGPGVADTLSITDAIPTGSTFVSASPGGTYDGATGVITWSSLGNLKAGAAGSVSFVVSVTTDGTYTNAARLQYYATLTSRTLSSNTTSTVRDATAPNTTLLTGPSGTVASSSAAFTFSSPDATATFECQLDAGAYTVCTSGQSYTGLTDASHTFNVRAKDPAGNVDATPASRTWLVDTTAPDTTLLTGPSGSITLKTAAFTFSSPDATATFECQLDSGTYAACTSGQSYANLADGPHTFNVRAKDPAGNVDATPASRTWTIDTVVPDTTLLTGPSGATASVNATFTFSSPEAGVTFECALDTLVYTACASGLAYSNLGQGSHTFNVRAKDAAGNVDATPASRTWTVDTVAPDTAIATFPAAQTNQTSATFTFTSPETGVTFECRLDTAATFSACTTPVTFSGLAATPHSIEVRAKDAAGNVDATPATYAWTVDTTAPDTTIVSGPAAQSPSASATFSFSSNESGVTYECALDTPTFTACTNPVTFTGLAQTSHTLQVRAKDSAGNVDASPASSTWTVDTTAPDTTISSGPLPQSASTSATFSFTSSETGVTYECRVDGTSATAFTTCANPLALTGLTQGAHTLDVRAKDAAGNVDASPATYSWTVDTLVPDTTLTGQPAAVTSATTAIFTFTSTESGATFECQLDAGALLACASGQSYAGLAASSHTFNVRAKDAAGNVDATPATYSWTVDTTPPDTTIISNPPAQTNLTTASFDFTATETGSTFECRLDGAAFAPCTRPISYSGLSSTSHTFDVRAKDAAGNLDPTAASFTWTIDASPPDTAITANPPAQSNSATASFAFTSTKAGSTFECQLDGGAFSACTTPRSYSGLTEGPHTFAVRAKDAAGTLDPTPATYAWTVDTTVPDTTIVSGPANPTNQTSASFTFSSTEAGVSYECNLDAAGFAACTNPVTFSNLAQSSHTLQVRARDGAGNLDATPASQTWTVDTTAPDTTLTANPPAQSNSTTATFSFTSNDPTATFECRLDGGSFTACTSPIGYTSLSEAPHTFSVRARDAAGNVDVTPASFNWTVDLTPPDTTIVTGPPAVSNSTTASFTFSSNETGATYECHLEGTSTFSACTNPASFTNLGQGSHTLTVRAKDAAGNVDATPAVQTWSVDTIVPETSITSGPGAVSNSTSATFSFSSDDPAATFECRLDGVGSFGACANPVTFNSLSQGARSLEVRARNAAGTVDASPATYSWTIDTGAPETSFTSTPPLISGSASATFAFSSDDPAAVFECRLDGALAGFTSCASPLTLGNLADAPHVLAVRARDSAGNVDASPATYSWLIDTAAPDTVIVSGPPSQSASTSATFDFSSAEVGVSYECRLDGAAFVACSDPVVYSGLAQGGHSLSVRARDAAGNVDATPASYGWNVDTVLPAAPTIALPMSGSSTSSSSVAVSGSAEPGATVRLFLDGTAAGTTIADGSGGWTLPLTGVGEGLHTLRAQAQDPAGNTSALSPTTIFSVDTVPPAAPVITAPANQSRTNNPLPTVSGTAEAGSTVTVRIDGAAQGSTIADANGAFAFATTTALADGMHTVNATATDRGGNASPASGTNTFFVDTQPPATPSITVPTAGAQLGTPRPTISGTAEAGVAVEVRVDGNVVGLVTATAGGTWSYALTAGQALGDGGHNTTARATDAAGNQSPTAGPVNFSVDTAAPAAPIIVQPTAGSRTSSPRPTVSGTAEPGASVRVFIDGTLVGTVTASTAGAWSYTLTLGQDLVEGGHSALAQATDVAGNSGPQSAPRAFTVDTTAPTPPQIVTPPSGTRSSDSTPTVSGLAEPLAKVDLYVDGVLAGSGNADAGGNWSIALGVLADGTRRLTARATDLAGNLSAASPQSLLIIDTSAPTPPSITVPAEGSRTSDNTPDVSGIAEAGATVAVWIDGALRATTVAGPSGTWIVTIATALGDGPHVATATAQDQAGNTSTFTPSRNFSIDTTPPSAPVIQQPANGSVTNDNRPVVSGASEPNATVRVFKDGVQVGTASADGTGAWTLPLAALADGTYSLRAQGVDEAGNVGPLSALTSFTVDTARPNAPVVVTPVDASRLNTARPTVTGTAEPLSIVTVRFDGLVAGTTTASPTGGWSFVPSAPLAEGPHNVSAVSADQAGNVSVPSPANSFVVDTVAPASPLITSPTQGQELSNPRPAVSGTGEGGSTVELRIDGTLIGVALVNSSGAWSYTLTAGQSLPDGPHTAVARAVDAAGNTSANSPQVTFVVDTVAPGAPVVTAPANGSRTANRTPTISGTADANSSVQVLVDGQPVGTVLAGSTGSWSYPLTVAQALGEGSHTASARATDAAGNVGGAATPVSFFVDLTAPGAPLITSPADNARLSTATPVVSGSAEPGATVTLFVNGAKEGTATANGGGSWTLTLQPKPDGAYALTAQATDQAGNASLTSATTNLVIDTTAPATPTITSPVNGASLSTHTPAITGTAEAGATVTVLDGSTVLGTVVAASTGAWTFQVPSVPGLVDGPHALTARATDAAGNVGPPSATSNVVVDTSAPAAPIISSPTSGQRLNQPHPSINGTAEIGALVTVTIDGNVIGTASAGAGGAWSVTPAETIADGTHVAGASAQDAAGNLSANATPVSFLVDTSAPGSVRIDSPSNGARLNLTTPTVFGTAEASSAVELFVDGTSVGTTVAETTGGWTLPISSALSEGPHTLTARATDTANNVGPLSDAVAIIIDLTAPSAPLIAVPAEAAVLATGTPSCSGTAEAGARVELRVDGNAVGSVVAGPTGAWSYTLTAQQALQSGPHAAIATARDAAGNVSTASATRNFTVDTVAPNQPVVQVPVAGTITRVTTPLVSGTAEANATVRVSIDGTLVGTVAASSSGAWTYTLGAGQALAEGNHQATAIAVDAAGNPSLPSLPSPFVIDLTAPAAPVVVNPANASVTGNNRPTISGSAEPNTSVTVVVDGAVVGLATASSTGAWQLTLSAALADDAHTVRATATDAAGNASLSSPTSTFVVDTIAPSAPLLTQPADGSHTNLTTPAIAGSAEPLAQVTVIVDGNPVGDVLADAQGRWTYTLAPAQALSDGMHTGSATSRDAAGNLSATSATVSFTVDTQPPTPPRVTQPVDGSRTNDVQPDVTGTAEPLATVQVFLDGVLAGTTLADASGAWTFFPSQPLTEGPHTLTARAVDESGNLSGTSLPVTVVIDITPPTLPVITAPTDGTITSDRTPDVSGTAESGATVEILVDGLPVGTTVAQSNGTWTFTVPDLNALSEGPHELAARATDVAGNSGLASASVTITVDVTPPAIPAVTAPRSGAELGTSTPTISGTAAAGERVTVRVDGTVVGSVVADGTGNWSYTLTPMQALTPGAHSATAQSVDAAGNRSPETTPTPFIIDVSAPNAPLITAPADGTRTNLPRPTLRGTTDANTRVTVSLDGRTLGTVLAAADGTWSYTLTAEQALAAGTYVARAIAVDGAGNPSVASAPVSFTVDLTAPTVPAITSPVDNATLGTGTPTLSGTAEPGSRVTLTLGGNALGTATTDSQGGWTYTLTPAQALSDGTYSVTVTAQDAAGNLSPTSAPSSFTVDTLVPAKPSITAPTQGQRLPTSTPTLAGTAEPFSRVTVTVDSLERGVVTADASGHWTLVLTPGQALSDGPHTAVATARDNAGNQSGQSDPRSFVVDTEAPTAPRVLTPPDGMRTADNSPLITGTAEAGATVQIYIDGDLAGTTTAGADGAWTFVSPLPLSEGAHTITAKSVDAAGNQSGVSPTVGVVIDTTAPGQPVIIAPVAGSLSRDPTPTISGTSEPGANVTVFVDGHPVGIAVADANGFWRYRLTQEQALADGEHTASAQATDVVGNQGLPASDVGFTVDTMVPQPPSILVPVNGSRLSDSTPEISGTAPANSRVLVFVDDLLVATVTSDANGHWTYTLTDAQALLDGPHTATARTVSPSGINSAAATPSSFEVDTVPPARPAVTKPTQGSTVNSGTPIIGGTGEPGSTIEVLVDGRSLGTTTVGSNGQWTFTPTPAQALPDGQHQVTAQARDGAGNLSDFAPPVGFTVEGAPLPAPVVQQPADASRTADSTPDVLGTTIPNGIVEVFIDGVSVGTTVADATGRWKLTVPTPLADGSHTVSARLRDGAGRVSQPSAANTFEVDSRAPTAPVIAPHPVQTNDPTPTVSGTAEPGTQIEVTVDGTPVGTVTVAPDGTWSVELPSQPDGPHAVGAVAVDAAGNRSPAAATTVVIDTTAPLPPVLTSPEDGQVFLDRPSISGTCEAGSLLRLELDGVSMTPFRCGADGTFTFVVPDSVDVPRGDHTAVAVAIDDLGNVSAPSNTVHFTIGVVSGAGFTCSTAEGGPGLLGLWLALAAAVLTVRRRRRANVRQRAALHP